MFRDNPPALARAVAMLPGGQHDEVDLGPEAEPPNEATLVDDERETPSNVDSARGIEAKQLRNAVHERLFGSVGEPIKIGRYTVLKSVGAGGMGIVYAAYDTELDRKIAIKLMQIGGKRPPERARARLLREGQALAKLSHPNVIQVYDVGEFQEQVFVAMEFIQGPTLKKWFQQRHPWSVVLAKLVEAGRGLAAAHAADVVHRDFKPANVMVGEDGRVRVLDFGLARPSGDRSGQYDMPSPESVSGSGTTMLTSLTRPGSVMGTPAYMAPEQHEGKPADARTDQFSYCVTLYEGLYGHRPFLGETREELRAAVLEGHLLEPPAERGVPKRIWKVLERGLSTRPDDRHASMDELLAELTWTPARRWRTWAGAASLVAMTALVVQLAGGFVSPCADVGDELHASWNAEHKHSVQQAFLGTDLPFAEDAWQSVSAKLDGYASRWSTSRVDACEATNIRNEQSAAGHDLRVACLNDRRARFEATADLFAGADADVVEHAVDAAAALPAVEYCDDVEALTRGVQLPEDSETRTRVTVVRDGLAQVDALEHAGKYQEALDLAKSTTSVAREVDYPPVLAEALYRLGSVHANLDDGNKAVSVLNEAVDLAEAHRHDELAADIWIALAAVARDLEDVSRGHQWVRRGRGAIGRIGGDDARLGRVLAASGELSYVEGTYAQAEVVLREGLIALGEDAGSATRAAALEALANTLAAAGRDDEALETYDATLNLVTRELGATHPKVGHVLVSKGDQLVKMGRIEGGQELLQRALQIYGEAYRGPHERIGIVHLAQVRVALRGGDLSVAIKHADLAQQMFADAGKPRPRAEALNALATAQFMQRDFERARESYAEAVALYEASLGAEHPDVALWHSNLGEALVALGRHADALREFDHALAVFDRTLAPDHEHLAFPLKGRGQALLGLGKVTEALEPLERALAVRKKHPSNQFELADIELALARALKKLGRQAKRVRTLGGSAMQRFGDLGDTRTVAEIADELGLPKPA